MKNFTKIKLIISIILLLILFLKADIKKIIEYSSLISPMFIIISLIIIILLPLLNTIKLKIFLRPYLKDITFTEFYKKYLISRCLGLFTPGKMGEFSLSYFIKKNIKPGETIAALIIDKIITFIVISIISILGLYLYLSKTIALQLTIFVLSLLVIAIIISKSIKIKQFILKKISKKLTDYLEDFSQTYENYFKKYKKEIFINFIITIINWNISGLGIYILLKLFQQNAPYFITLFITCTGAISIIIPITMNGLGLNEAINIYLFGQFNIQKEPLLMIFLIMIFLDYILAIIFFQLFFNQKTIKPENLPKNDEHTINKPTINK